MRNVIFTAVAALVLAAGTAPSLAAHAGTSGAQSQQQVTQDQQNAQHNNRCADVRANPEAYSRIEAENCR
jgi:hypothetical protein